MSGDFPARHELALSAFTYCGDVLEARGRAVGGAALGCRVGRWLAMVDAIVLIALRDAVRAKMHHAMGSRA
jgi:hypothetical protein